MKDKREEPIEDKALEEMLKDFFNAGYDYRSSLMPESIEEFGKNCQPNFKTYYSEYEFIAGYKANQSDAVDRWISVEEKPNKNLYQKRVLMLANGGYIEVGYFNGEDWVGDRDGTPMTKRGYDVTHWQPLPPSK